MWAAMISQVRRSAAAGVRNFGRVQPSVCLIIRKVCSRLNRHGLHFLKDRRLVAVGWQSAGPKPAEREALLERWCGPAKASAGPVGDEGGDVLGGFEVGHETDLQ